MKSKKKNWKNTTSIKDYTYQDDLEKGVVYDSPTKRAKNRKKKKAKLVR